ncbi:MAG TPA: hypothetical protein GXZ50_04055 [Clostridia bacterium]|nr:hypothetical protein [Clostridia bacterium]
MPEKEKIADVKEGLGSRDNLRFIRYWWEVKVEDIMEEKHMSKYKKWACGISGYASKSYPSLD